MANVGIETMTERQLMAKVDAKLAKAATSKPKRPKTIALGGGGLNPMGGASVNCASETVRIDSPEFASPVDVANAVCGSLKVDKAMAVEVLVGESANPGDYYPLIGPNGQPTRLKLKVGQNVLPNWIWSGAQFARFVGPKASGRFHQRFGG